MTKVPLAANAVIQVSRDAVETVLKTIHDRPIETVWIHQARRTLTGIGKAMIRTRDELVATLTELEKRKAEVE